MGASIWMQSAQSIPSFHQPIHPLTGRSFVGKLFFVGAQTWFSGKYLHVKAASNDDDAPVGPAGRNPMGYSNLSKTPSSCLYMGELLVTTQHQHVPYCTHHYNAQHSNHSNRLLGTLTDLVTTTTTSASINLQFKRLLFLHICRQNFALPNYSKLPLYIPEILIFVNNNKQPS